MMNRLIISVLLLLLSTISFALEEKEFCIYDPVGRNGPAVNFFKDYVIKAQAWGIKINMTAYTDEKVASHTFKAGQCDAAFLTGILSRPYVPFGGTIDAIGGIVDQKGLAMVLKTLTNPKLSEYLTNGNYEVIGTLPVGSVYMFLRDKNYGGLSDYSGKKMSVLNEDAQALKFANLAGASPVGTSLATFSGQFNNGNIDMLPMVALAYDIFELYHGLGDKGGIIDQKTLYGMMQLVAHKDRFPEGYGLKTREYILSRLPDINDMVKNAEEAIPEKHWIRTTPEQKAAIIEFVGKVRAELAKDGVHHPKALKLLKSIRCKNDPTRSECAG